MAEDNANPLAGAKRGRPRKEVEAAPVESGQEPVQEVSSETEEVYTLTASEMKAFKDLISKSQTQAVSAGQDGIVESLIVALREANKPYKSDAEKLNEEAQTAQMRELVKRQKRNEEIEQAYCHHMAGCNQLSHREADTTSIIWHEVHNHLWIGVCTVCQRQFWPSDEDYGYWRRRRSFNTASRSGDRQGIDNAKYVKQEHPQPFGTITGIKPTMVPSASVPLWQTV